MWLSRWAEETSREVLGESFAVLGQDKSPSSEPSNHWEAEMKLDKPRSVVPNSATASKVYLPSSDFHGLEGKFRFQNLEFLFGGELKQGLLKLAQ